MLSRNLRRRLTSSITGGCDIGGDPPPHPLTELIIALNSIERN
jgi:hypothetical protein